MIDVKNLVAGYGKKNVLKDITADFKKGKIYGIIGPNGCGKSTFLKSLIGLCDVKSGEISICGKDVSRYTNNEIAKHIAYLPQSKQIPDITVKRLVLHGRFPHIGYPRRYREEDVKKAEEAIAKLGLSCIAERTVASLSGGERQKVYIAMALCQESPIILMDEPTTYLDIRHQLKLCEVINELSGMGKTVIVVLHDLSLAFDLCDEINVMFEGEIIASGTAEELFRENAIEKAFGATLKKAEIEGKIKYLI